jgi:hypothetical protein
MTRASADNPDEVAKALKSSLENADRGLSLFLASLEGSGLPDALRGYRQLQMVLIQQRLWARNHARDDLAPLFQTISVTAGRIHAILSPYAELMSPLKDLDNISEAQVEDGGKPAEPATLTEPPSEPPAQARPPRPAARRRRAPRLPSGRQASAIVGLLMTSGPQSATKIAQATGGDRGKIQKVLDRLVESGVVLGEAGRKRPSYRLSPRFIREGLRLLRAESGGKLSENNPRDHL